MKISDKGYYYEIKTLKGPIIVYNPIAGEDL